MYYHICVCHVLIYITHLHTYLYKVTALLKVSQSYLYKVIALFDVVHGLVCFAS